MPSIAEQNRLRVLDLLRRYGSLSRQQLANLTGLDSSTLSKMISDLLKKNVLEEAGKATSTGVGKKQVLLNIASSAGSVLGINTGGNEATLCLTGIDGKPIATESQPLTSLEELLPIIADFTSRHIDKEAPLRGIGIGIPGIIDNENGKIIRYAGYQAIDMPLANMISEASNVPCILENAGNAAALSESLSSIDSTTSLLYLNITFREIGEFTHIGFGTGLVINNQLYTGNGFGAGELPGPLNPGQRLPKFSTDSLCHLWEDHRSLTPEILEIIEQISNSLTLLNVFFAPDRLVIGANRQIKNHLFVSEISKKVVEKSRRACLISPNKYGAHAPAIGAALSMINQLPLSCLFQEQ